MDRGIEVKKILIIIICYYIQIANLDAQIFKQNYTWLFDGQAYSMQLILNTRTYEYYHRSDKRLLFTKDAALGKFFNAKDNDNLIKMLADKLIVLARKANIPTEQIPDFATAFVQFIPYDSTKASKILAENWAADTDLYFHYETIYLNKGVCTDKSILLVSILRYLGYGAAVILMEQENHAAAAIYNPSDTQLNNAKYSYIETTTAAPIGYIPEHINIKNIEILQKTSGKAYKSK